MKKFMVVLAAMAVAVGISACSSTCPKAPAVVAPAAKAPAIKAPAPAQVAPTVKAAQPVAPVAPVKPVAPVAK